jgi:predicted DNA-binding protein (UPF0251 family)
MPRPRQCRRIGLLPEASAFKPAGVPGRLLPEVVLTLDELEAIRLADLEGMYQEDAASHMGVSRQTFGNIVASARSKIADCIVRGKMLRIQGGPVTVLPQRRFQCAACRHAWNEPHGTGRPEGCPACRSPDFHRQLMEGAPKDAVHGKRRHE